MMGTITYLLFSSSTPLSVSPEGSQGVRSLATIYYLLLLFFATKLLDVNSNCWAEYNSLKPIILLLLVTGVVIYACLSPMSLRKPQ